MSDAAETPGVVYCIWQNDDSRCALDPEDAPLIERAMREWSEKGRDCWLSLTTADGSAFSVLASTITSAILSTAEQRRAGIFREKALVVERADNRRDAGYIESESP